MTTTSTTTAGLSRSTEKILFFLLLTFGVDWAMVGIFLLIAGKPSAMSFTVLGAAYMLVPMLAAIIVQKAVYKEPLVRPLGMSLKLNRWFLVAWLMPPVLAFAAMAAALLLPGVSFTPDMSGFFKYMALTPDQVAAAQQQAAALPINPIWLTLIQALIAGPTINAVFAFGEEVGWRGFLLGELRFLGFWRSSALIGVIWGVWHAPLILLGHNYPHHPQLGVLIMVGWTLVLAPMFSYVRIKAKSVIAAAVLHGTINAVPGLALMLLAGGNELLIGITGLAGFIVFAIVDLLIFLFDRFITRDPASRALRTLGAPGVL